MASNFYKRNPNKQNSREEGEMTWAGGVFAFTNKEYIHEAREAEKKKSTKWTTLRETKEWGWVGSKSSAGWISWSDNPSTTSEDQDTFSWMEILGSERPHVSSTRSRRSSTATWSPKDEVQNMPWRMTTTCASWMTSKARSWSSGWMSSWGQRTCSCGCWEVRTWGRPASFPPLSSPTSP